MIRVRERERGGKNRIELNEEREKKRRWEMREDGGEREMREKDVLQESMHQ